MEDIADGTSSLLAS